MGGWNSNAHGWSGVRRTGSSRSPAVPGRWTAPDVAAVAVAFVLRWELGLAFLALKLWQQATGTPGNVFTFARDRWEALVGVARGLLSGSTMATFHVGPRSSGNKAFDMWRQTELSRIDDERDRLRRAEREFADYRDELLHAKDREDFERFMQARQDVPAPSAAERR